MRKVKDTEKKRDGFQSNFLEMLETRGELGI